MATTTKALTIADKFKTGPVWSDPEELDDVWHYSITATVSGNDMQGRFTVEISNAPPATPASDRIWVPLEHKDLAGQGSVAFFASNAGYRWVRLRAESTTTDRKSLAAEISLKEH